MSKVVRATPHPSYKTYGMYKGQLRQDFSYACVYCTVHENEWGGPRHFQVEHLRPKRWYPSLETKYTNLLYACDVCNCFKGDDWPPDGQIIGGFGYLDPCEHDYDLEFMLDRSTGEVQGRSAQAKYMVEKLHLNRRSLTRLRWERAMEADIQDLFDRLHNSGWAVVETVLVREGLSEADRDGLNTLWLIIEAFYSDKRSKWDTRRKPQYSLDDYR